jgi:3-methyladenine DNA glycosylase/8-oxoguanine DNA glycosylase
VSEPTSSRTTVRPGLPVDLDTTLWPLRRGFRDPSTRRGPDGSWWRAAWTPEGPATARYAHAADGTIEVEAWGEGAERLLADASGLVGGRDSLDGFDPGTGLVRDLHRRFPGLRMTRTSTVFSVLVPAVLEQKWTGEEAREAYRSVVLAWGSVAPGPMRLRVPPPAEVVAAKAPWEFHPLNVEGRRANVLRFAAARSTRLEETGEMSFGEARRRLLAFPGVGAWTAAEVALVALGDPDAVSVGDYHLPNTVSWALAGEPRGTDERMLELLEPYAGHRGRVLRLLTAAAIAAPRRGPRRRIHPVAKI